MLIDFNNQFFYFFLYLGVPGQGHQQHRGVQPLHEDWQLVQARPKEVQVSG